MSAANPNRTAGVNPAGDVQAQFELSEQTRAAFLRGLTIDEAVADLTLAAMNLGIEADEAAQLIREFFETCAKREPPADMIARLAALDRTRYEALRTGTASRLGWRVSVLDAEVVAAREKRAGGGAAGNSQSNALIAPDPEPWSEPVDGAALLDEIATLLATYITAPRAVIDAAALWILYVHTFVRIELPVATRLFLTSATRRCGKSRLLRLLTALAPRALSASRMSPSALFRVIEKVRPIIFLDESDGFIAESPDFRNLINAGFEPDQAYVVINVPVGDDWEPTRFNVFTPIALAGIGKLADTIEDRAIKFPMQRQPQAARRPRLRMREVRPRIEELKRRAMSWAADNASAVAAARPALPAVLDDRAGDLWEPLLAIAQVLAGAWPERTIQAATILSGNRDGEDDSLSVRLLRDIRAVFEASGVDRLASKTLCERLAAIEDAPWAEIHRGKPITQNQLARRLEPFQIAPRTIRLPDGSTPKGYLLDSFRGVFAAYFPDSKRHNATTQRREGESCDFQTATEGACGVPENGTNPNGERRCGGVADRNPRTATADSDRELF